ncbi:hypothetical protein ACHHYP_00300 [Achlya hypogyna]|uniref:Uncharacterized protein n=1 Tax=Achlya hypogyna TaxID=1202772 RepID=A0A1V9ZVB6_ACHHY|nr:hypothetical protein ACHHYP_00300 [Achlya hypogyna]
MNQPFRLMNGVITNTGFAAAAREFLLRTERGEQLEPFLIAFNIPIKRWRTSDMTGRHHGVVLWATYDGDANSAATLGSIYIVRATSPAHQSAVNNINAQLHVQCHPWRHIITTGIAPTYAANGQCRTPDINIRPFGTSGAANLGPRMVVEVDIYHRTYPKAKDWIEQYFTMLPSLRTAIAFKTFGSQGGDHYAFGAVVLVYRRQADDPVHNVPGAPMLVYGASIGTAPLSRQSRTSMSPADEALFDANAFHEAIAEEIALGHLEWAAATPRPVIRLHVEDLFYVDVHNLLAGAPPHAQNLEIDIYQVILSARSDMGVVFY